MQLSHSRPVASALFDDPNLVSCAGLVPIAVLAGQCGLAALADEHLSVPTDKGSNAGAKVSVDPQSGKADWRIVTTLVLPLLTYREAFEGFRFGQSAAVAVVILMTTLVFSFFYLRFRDKLLEQA